MGVHEREVERCGIDRAADPLAQVLVLLVGGVRKHGEEVLVTPRASDILLLS